MSLKKYLDQFNFSRVHFEKLEPLTLVNMRLADANRVAESLSAAWSPENLTCDGELSRAQVQARARVIRNAAYELMVMFPELTIPEWSEDLFDVPQSVKKSFVVGQKVQINHPKLGGLATGTVLKVNRVKCRVEFPVKGTFNVPFSMLEII